ncbi:MAG TPA: SDR family oxidoreductase [Actinomycetales bacterium]|nr:SDR family oxidoreductase [Actinomycetales bacterium]
MTTALVTGGTSGIGLAFARRFAAEGRDLVLVARDRDRLAAVAGDLIDRHGVGVEVLVADLSARDQLQSVADRLGDASRPVDLLVNNAGFGLKRRFVEGELAAEEQMFDVLCRAVLVLSHAGAQAMIRRGSGAIVNVSSVAGFTAGGSYAAAKAWVTTFTEGLACELRGTGVTATALCPGFVRTEMHQRADMTMRSIPARAWLDADELVAAAMADVRRGRVISVPTVRYKVAALLARKGPRAVVRRVTGSRPRSRH